MSQADPASVSALIARLLQMKLRPALAQLRHAYWNLTSLGPSLTPDQQREFAEGLIAPQIRRLEEFEGEAAAALRSSLASPPLPEHLIGDPLTSQLLDLIRLMPDNQTQVIVDFIADMRAIRSAASPPHENRQPSLAYLYLGDELRQWLETQTITGDTIGDIRRACFVPWDSRWNGLVRDETASREKKTQQ